MNQLREVCRMIEVIQDETIKLEAARAGIEDIKKESLKEKKDLFDYFLPRTQTVIAEYETRYKCTNYQARSAFKDAVTAEEKYVSTYNDDYKEMPDYPFADYVEVNPSGRVLNSKIFKVIPTGRYNKWLGDHNHLVTFVFGSGVGAVLAVLSFIIKAVLDE